MKKIRSVLSRIVYALIFVASVIILWGGCLYYSKTIEDSNWLTVFCASLQNLAETLLFNPVLTLEDYYSAFPEHSIMTIAFEITVALTPLIDLIIVFSIFNFFINVRIWVTAPLKTKVLVVGNNPEIDRILEETVKDKRIYRWTEELISEERKKDYLERCIRVKENDFSLGDSRGEYPLQVKKFNSFLRKKKIKQVVLLDEKDAHNIQYYMALSSCDICKEKTIKFFVLINDFEMKNFLQNYFDNTLVKEFGNGRSSVKKGVNTHMDLNIFNLQQLNAEETAHRFPITGNPEKNNDVHILIIGGGQAGEEMIVHSINQSVLSSTNEIIIDVLDRDIAPLSERLKKRFNQKYFTYSENNNEQTVFSIPENRADGELKIRITKCDVYDDVFIETVNKLQNAGNGGRYTYISLCLQSPNNNLHIMNSLRNSEITAYKLPVAIRMSYTEEMEEYLKSFEFCSDVLLVGENDEYIGIDEIVNEKREDEMRRFHKRYDELADTSVWGGAKDYDIDTLWNYNPYYKRESNRALYFHKPVKNVLFNNEEFKAEARKFWDSAKSDKDSVEIPEWITGKNSEYTANPDLQLSLLLIQKEDNGKYKYPQLLEFAKTEHRRFTYFFASQGWGYTDSPDKDEDKKLHNCLTTWDGLTKERPEDDSRISKLIYDLIAVPTEMEAQ